MRDSHASPAEVQKELKGVDYPASKQDLVEYAARKDRNSGVLDLLNQIPDKIYNSPVDVSKAIGDLD